MSNTKRGLFKKTITKQRDDVINEIARLEELIKTDKNVDYKVVFTRISCLQSHLRDLEILIGICVERNKF